jgi:hypothetical protein
MEVILRQGDLSSGQVHIDIQIRADLNVSAFVARQKVTGYVLDHVSDHMAGGEPSLVIDGERFLWRVPVLLALPPRGQLGQAVTIDVDAQSGEVLVTDQLLEELHHRARTLVESHAA